MGWPLQITWLEFQEDDEPREISALKGWSL
jgi:hypothetical protein